MFKTKTFWVALTAALVKATGMGFDDAFIQQLGELIWFGVAFTLRDSILKQSKKS